MAITAASVVLLALTVWPRRRMWPQRHGACAGRQPCLGKMFTCLFLTDARPLKILALGSMTRGRDTAFRRLAFEGIAIAAIATLAVTTTLGTNILRHLIGVLQVALGVQMMVVALAPRRARPPGAGKLESSPRILLVCWVYMRTIERAIVSL